MKPPFSKPGVDSQSLDLLSCEGSMNLLENANINGGFTSDRSRRTDPRVGIVAVSCALVCLIVCVSLLVYTRSSMALMEAQIVLLKKEVSALRRETESRPLSEHQAVTDDRSNQEEAPELVTRQKRNTGHGSLIFAHLDGKNTARASVGSNNLFKWDSARRIHGLQLVPNAADATSIKIQTQGVYLVYAQIAVHGRNSLSYPNTCSHRTVRRRGNTDTNLLVSLATQYNLGLRYQHGSDFVKPQDTQLQMGVFFLLPNDELSVQVPPHCLNQDYSITSENSYFGVVKLGQ